MSASSTSSTASCSSKPAAANGPKDSTYADYPYNSRLGRVGKPKGTHVVHNDGSSGVDGGVFFPCTASQQKRFIADAIEKRYIADAIEKHYEDQVNKFEHLNIDDSTFYGIEENTTTSHAARVVRLENIDDSTFYGTKENTTTSHAARVVRLENIEENWKKREIIPQTILSR